MNALECLRIVLNSGMIEECDARYGQRNWIFHQDGAFWAGVREKAPPILCRWTRCLAVRCGEVRCGAVLA